MLNFFPLALNSIGKIRVSKAGEIIKVLDNGINHLASQNANSLGFLFVSHHF